MSSAEALLSYATLTPSDLDQFGRLRIPSELLLESGLRRVSDREARDAFGITGDGSMDGIVFPYFVPDNPHRVTCRLRRDHPDDEGGQSKRNYISPHGDRKHVYFPPGAQQKLSDPNLQIVLVEAENGALAGMAWARREGITNLLFVALGGCWGWRERFGKTDGASGDRVDVTGLVPDLAYCNGQKVYVLFDANVATNSKVRIARSALAAQLRRQRCTVFLCALPNAEGVDGPDEYLGIAGDAAFAKVLADAEEDVEPPPGCSDDALALRFADLHGNDLSYTAGWGKWNYWTGARWEPDTTLHVFDKVRALCRTAAVGLEDRRMATKITSAATVAAVERLSRYDRRHAATIAQWDSDLWLFNTPGGTIDLRVGTLRAARREDFITKMTAITPGGTCPQWLRFLDRVAGGDKELQAFLQRMCGYALTGSTVEHAGFFLYGTGANGKSVFINTVAGALGEYAKTAPIEAFIDSRTERHPTDLAGLHGARLVLLPKPKMADAGQKVS